MLPNFIIAGAGKAGTTSLYYMLDQHPDIFMSSVKEPNFFSFYGRQASSISREEKVVYDHSVKTISDYGKLFAAATPNQTKGEGSQRYFADAYSLEQIGKLIPDVKIILVLRNPTDRAYSLYLHFKRDGRETRNPKEAFFATEQPTTNLYLKGGFYGKFLQSWLRSFPKQNICVCIYDDFINDPIQFSRRIYDFLGVETQFTPATGMRSNVSGIPKNPFAKMVILSINWIKKRTRKHIHGALRRTLVAFGDKLTSTMIKKPNIDSAVKNTLVGIYREDIVLLEQLTGYDLSKWKQPSWPIV